jgi:hypothetical protein
MLAAASANAAIYTLTFTGPDFTTGGVVGGPVTQVLTALSPGAQGYPGGPMQSWNLGSPVSSIGGWIDFSSDGESVNLEGGTVGFALAAASAFFSLGGSSPPFTLSFLDFPNNSGTQTYSITNVSYGATFGGCPGIGYGNIDTLTIEAVPEPSTWAMMLLGFAGFGLAGYWFGRKSAMDAAGHGAV